MGQGLQGILAILLVVSGRARVSCDPEGVKNEHLLTLAAVDGSAAITVTPREGGHSHYHPFPHEAQISPACSTDVRSSRCRRVYIDAIGNNQFIIIVALENAVGVMLFRYNGAELVRKTASVLSITNTLQIGQCVPLEIIHFNNHPMVLCLDQQQLWSCDIKVNRSDVTQSSLARCIHFPNFPTAINYEQVSNFIHFSEISQVIVVIQQSVYGIRFDRRDFRWYVHLDDSTCDRISYVGDHTFHITCRSGMVFEYNTDTELLRSHLSHGDGIPVPCPSSTTFTLIQGGNDTVVRHSSGVEMTIPRLSFLSGLCSPAGVLYITDQRGGIMVVNAISRSYQRLSIHSRHLEVFDGEYSVVLSDNPSKSVLYNKSLEHIAERRGEGQAVGVILSLTIMTPPPTVPSPASSSTSDVPTTRKPTSKKPMRSPPKAALGPEAWTGVGIGVFSFIVLNIFLLPAIPVIVILLYIKKCKNLDGRRGLPQCVPTAASSSTDVRDAGVRDTDLDGASSDDEVNTAIPVTTAPIEAHDAVPAVGTTQQVQ